MVVICPSKCLMEKTSLQGMWSSFIFVTCICREYGCLSTDTVDWWKAEPKSPLWWFAFCLSVILPMFSHYLVRYRMWAGLITTIEWIGIIHRVHRVLFSSFQNFQNAFFVAFLVLAYFGLYVTVHLFCWNHWVQILGRVVERRVKACWMVKKS